MCEALMSFASRYHSNHAVEGAVLGLGPKFFVYRFVEDHGKVLFLCKHVHQVFKEALSCDLAISFAVKLWQQHWFLDGRPPDYRVVEVLPPLPHVCLVNGEAAHSAPHSYGLFDQWTLPGGKYFNNFTWKYA